MWLLSFLLPFFSFLCLSFQLIPREFFFSYSPALFLLFPPSSFSSLSFTSDFPPSSSAVILLTSSVFLSSRLSLSLPPSFPSALAAHFPLLHFFFYSFIHLFLIPSLTLLLPIFFYSVCSQFFPFTSTLPPLFLSRSVFLNHLSVLQCDHSSLFSHVHTSSLALTPLRIVFEGVVLLGFVRSAAVWQFDTHICTSTAVYAAERSLPDKTLRRLSVYQLYNSFTLPALYVSLCSRAHTLRVRVRGFHFTVKVPTRQCITPPPPLHRH